ncbi:hypothetical protein ACIQUF_00740 [Pseudomonas sp. NPDC090233]|uniref:hypothetical protein n=1 Tax=Pseudomonas sp. NPDC090233 TaxID=3364479 RepID=UPI00383A3407
MHAGGKNQFQNESGFTGLQPAFYKGRRKSFGTGFCHVSADNVALSAPPFRHHHPRGFRMHKDPEVVVTKQRTLHTYSELWHASKCVLDVGLAEPDGCSRQFLSSALLTAFCFEAYMNHLGAKYLPVWKALERLSPLEKMEMLCHEFDVKFPHGMGGRPLQTVDKLFRFRNAIAHGKTMDLNYKTKAMTVKNYQAEHEKMLLADWEVLITNSEFAQRAREDVQAVLTKLHEASGEDDLLFSYGASLHSSTLVIS